MTATDFHSMEMTRLSGKTRHCAGSRWLLAWLFALAFEVAVAATPRGYPRSYADVVEAARREGTVVVYSTTDREEVARALAAFRKRYPFLKVDYHELESPKLYERVIAESRARSATGDLVWSSAMDLQIKLVNDGYAQAYASPEKPNLPDWAIWKNEAWGVTAEPVVIVYNKRLVPPADVPRTHDAFERLLRAKAERYTGRVSTYDPRRSGFGYLQLTQDLHVRRGDVWSLAEALGTVRARQHSSSRSLLAEVESGRSALAYNALGSYALKRAADNPDIGVVMPEDYTLVVSRIALITREARQPHAAKLLLDFLLSAEGQGELAAAYMAPSREDVTALSGTRPRAAIARPVRLAPSLLANLDAIRRERLLARWQAALDGR
jgi:iron(III) transport system substrate-binding protein